MKLQFTDNLNAFGYTFCKLPAIEGIFSLDDSPAKYYSEEELKDYFAIHYNAGQRVFDVSFDKKATDTWNAEWNVEKAKVFEFFREISSTEDFKRGLKDMIDRM